MVNKSITLVDYGVGNLFSVERAFQSLGIDVLRSSSKADILNADRIVFPGVGAFANAMHALDRLDIIDPLIQAANKGTPFLGLCLGMQLLFDESEEFGLTAGLGLIPGRVVPIPDKTPAGLSLHIPHISWKEIYPNGDAGVWENTILSNHSPEDSVYFVHSFMAEPAQSEHCLAISYYGENRITAVVAKDNIVGCQFHPEKSGEVGLKLLEVFSSL